MQFEGVGDVVLVERRRGRGDGRVLLTSMSDELLLLMLLVDKEAESMVDEDNEGTDADVVPEVDVVIVVARCSDSELDELPKLLLVGSDKDETVGNACD